MAKNGKSTALAKVQFAALASAEAAEELAEVILENVGPRGLTADQLERLSWPTGGTTFWEVPNTEGGKEPVKDMVGVVLSFRDVRVYWSKPFSETGGGTPPDCYSDDAVIGIGSPGGVCASCPYNVWGTAINDKGEKTRGKACAERRLYLFLRPEDRLPVIINIPPTSLGVATSYGRRLANQVIRISKVVSNFALQKDKSGDGIEFSLLDPKMVRLLTDEEVANLKLYAETVVPAFKKVDISKEADARSGKDDFDGEEEA